MVELKTQYPYVDDKGVIHNNLIKHYAEDENGNKFCIIQKETGIKFDFAIDVYPCRYTYEVLVDAIDDSEDEDDENN